MNCTLLTTPADLANLAPAWSDLLGRSRSNDISLTPLWLTTWWRIFGADRGRRLCCVAFHDAGRLVGFAPLTRRRHWYRPGLPFRRIEFLSTGERLEEAICPDYLNVVAEVGREEAVAQALAELLHTGKLGAWDEVFLETLASDNPLTSHLETVLRRARNQVTREDYDTDLHIVLPATWDAYLARIGKHRKSMLQALRYFDEWASGEWLLRRADSPATLDEGKAVLLALHASRWAGTDKGTFKAPRFVAFHDALMPALLAEGNLQLVWLVVRGEPVVAAYNMVYAGKVWYYQTGRKLDVPSKVSPGIVLLLMLIRESIEQGRREFDFLPGVARYKEQLGTESRTIVRVRAARPTWVETLRVWSRRFLRRAP